MKDDVDVSSPEPQVSEKGKVSLPNHKATHKARLPGLHVYAETVKQSLPKPYATTGSREVINQEAVDSEDGSNPSDYLRRICTI